MSAVGGETRERPGGGVEERAREQAEPGRVLVEISDLAKSYRRGSETIHVFQDVDLQIREGEFLALMGPSGSGKSTLLNILAGLDTPDRGSVVVDGQDITRMNGRRLAAWRSTHVGFIFQFYNLLPVLTAAQNVELPLLLTRLSKKQRRDHVMTALEVVGLTDRAEHFPRQLSGGQQQRVGIARAIVSDPVMILADEPTGDLDAASGKEVLDLLQRLSREFGKTILMVTHDAHAAERALAIMHMDKGVLSR
jgi:putative ABC transport system ATP-binding protein